MGPTSTPPTAPHSAWNGEAAEALPDVAAPAQLPLFPPDELAAAPPQARKRRARLGHRIRALLGHPAAPLDPPTTSFWPDSFFDEQA